MVAAMNRLVLTLVLVVVILAFLVGFLVGFPGLQALTVDTTTHTANAYGWEAVGSQANGQLLDASVYVTSYATNLDSEKIVFQGGATRHFGSLACLTEIRYRGYTSPNGVTWTELASSPWTFPLPQGAVTGATFTAVTTQLRGPYEGAFRLDMEFHVLDVALPGCVGGLDKGWVWVAQDQAYLKSGIGSITAPDQAQIGQTITVTARIPYVTTEKDGAKGWSVIGYSGAANAIIVGPLKLTQLVQSVTYTVTVSDFTTAGACRNELTWVLRNELWEKDFKTTTTIDASQYAPSVKITAVDGDRLLGHPVTVHWNATVNPVTQFPITKYVVKYGFGGVDNENVLPASQTSYTFTPGQGGTVHFEVIAYDTGCRPSPTAEVDIGIRDPQYSGGASGPNVLGFVVVVIIVALIGVLIAYAVKMPLVFRIAIIAAFVVVGFVAAAVVVPGVV